MSQPPQWRSPEGSDQAWTPPSEPQQRGRAPQEPPWAPPRTPGTSPGWRPAATPRQGVVPLRPLGVGEILDGAFAVLRRAPRVTLGWSALVLVVAQLVNLAIAAAAGNVAIDSTSPTLTPTFSIGGVVIAQYAITATATGVLTGIVAVIVGEAVLGRSESFGGVWRRIRPLAGPLLGAGFLAGFLPYVGLLAFIIGGVFLWGALALTTPALVLERLGVGAALRRSWRLAVPAWWRVWGIRALAAVLAGLASLVLVLPAGLFAGASILSTLAEDSVTEPGVAVTVVVLLFSLVAAILTQPYVAAVTALLYVDRRMRAEGLDIALARAAGEPPAGPGSSPAAGPPSRW